MIFRYRLFACVNIAILLFSLYGCSDLSSHNEFYGTWELSEINNVDHLHIDEVDIQLQIASDGNVKIVFLQKGKNPEIGTGKIEGSYLVFDDNEVMRISYVSGRIKLSDPHSEDSWLILKKI